MSGARVHRHGWKGDIPDDMSNASLGTAAAFKDAPGGLFLKDGDYNIEFLQTFITKPLNSNRAAAKPLRQAVAYKDVPEGFKPRTVIYFKKVRAMLRARGAKRRCCMSSFSSATRIAPLRLRLLSRHFCSSTL